RRRGWWCRGSPQTASSSRWWSCRDTPGSSAASSTPSTRASPPTRTRCSCRTSVPRLRASGGAGRRRVSASARRPRGRRSWRRRHRRQCGRPSARLERGRVERGRRRAHRALRVPGMSRIELAPGITVGGDGFPFIAGPCVIESEELALETARRLAAMAHRLGLPLIFKASFDKANRTSVKSFRGPGLHDGLRVLRRVREETGRPLLTDVHEPAQCALAAEVCDVLQIPAFLSRQTDLLLAAARTGRAVNVKKGQFLAPEDARHAVEKAAAVGNHRVFVTERGVSFGYHNLIVDMRSFTVLHELGIPVVFDVTHSLQLPSAG